MKTFKTKSNFNSVKVFNQKEELIGEIITPFIISGLFEKIKTNNAIFKIKGAGFLWNDIKIYDNDNYLICKSDNFKKRIIYFGEAIEY
ncbi:hypothetical protein [Soonwooa sp.]|uniref:hypothetical protein n=1 Tax=Soonwooa sp. TaxID=1938592 RepID=UPI0026307F9D|nr:hypothetical protein [Soonwooa sp.]